VRRGWTSTALAAVALAAGVTSATAASSNPIAGGPTTVGDSCGPAVQAPDVAPMGQVERETEGANVELDQTVLVSPQRFDLDDPLGADSSFTCVLTVRSRRSEPAQYEVVPLGLVGTDDLAAGGREYFDERDERFADGMGPWIEPAVGTIVIPPRGVARIPFRVTVPADAPTGAAYGAIGVVSRARASDGTDGAPNLGIESVVASSILLALPGDAAPDLRFRELSAPSVRWDREAWPFSAVVDNVGARHATAQGRVRIRSIFGSEVASLPLEQRTLLPGARSPVEATWSKVPWFGVYRWDARMSSDSEPRSVALAEGWLLALPPWWVLALVGITLLALVVRSIRRRTRDWDEDLDGDDDHHAPDEFDFDLAERQLRE
jgi:hypothetical protein